MLPNISHMSGEGLWCRRLPLYRNSWAKTPACEKGRGGGCCSQSERDPPERVWHQENPPASPAGFPAPRAARSPAHSSELTEVVSGRGTAGGPLDIPAGEPQNDTGRATSGSRRAVGRGDGANGFPVPGPSTPPWVVYPDSRGAHDGPLPETTPASRGAAPGPGSDAPCSLEQGRVGKTCAWGPGPVAGHRPDTAPAPPVPTRHPTKANREINFSFSPSSGICRRTNNYSREPAR